MLLEAPDRQRGFGKERILRVLLDHPGGKLSKRKIAKEANTTSGWVVRFTNQLEDSGYLQGTHVLEARGLYDYWLEERIDPSTAEVSLQTPGETIEESGLKYAFTTYQAENAHQGFLFPSNTALYIDPDEIDRWLSVIENEGLIGGGNTEIRVLDSHVFYGAETVNSLRTVSVPQLIVDLLDEGGQCVEAAERLIDAYHESAHNE